MWFFSKKVERRYTDVQYHADDLLVFGKETLGLPESLLQRHPESTLRVPMAPEARSLNLAAAVAVCQYEAIRQLQINLPNSITES